MVQNFSHCKFSVCHDSLRSASCRDSCNMYRSKPTTPVIEELTEFTQRMKHCLQNIPPGDIMAKVPPLYTVTMIGPMAVTYHNGVVTTSLCLVHENLKELEHAVERCCLLRKWVEFTRRIPLEFVTSRYEAWFPEISRDPIIA